VPYNDVEELMTGTQVNNMLRDSAGRWS